jgi:hypothetical protein
MIIFGDFMGKKQQNLNRIFLMFLTISGIFFVGCTQLLWQMDDGTQLSHIDSKI